MSESFYDVNLLYATGLKLTVALFSSIGNRISYNEDIDINLRQEGKLIKLKKVALLFPEDFAFKVLKKYFKVKYYKLESTECQRIIIFMDKANNKIANIASIPEGDSFEIDLQKISMYHQDFKNLSSPIVRIP